MAKLHLDEEIEHWRSLGQCLNRGDLVLSPFEQPFEEERRTDSDQLDDNVNFSDIDNLCATAEPDTIEVKKSVSGIHYKERFKYFLDGSIRTKYVGEYVEGNLSFPIIVSEVAAAVIAKKGRRLEPSQLEKSIAFVFPHKDSGLISDSTFARLQNAQRSLETSNSVSSIEFLKKTDIKGDVRTSLLGKVRSIMHDMEHEVAAKLSRATREWLVMDGAIRKQEFIELENTIGLAKSFSRKPILSFGGGIVTLSSYMKHIREGERSAILKKANPIDSVSRNVAFWYQRIRTFPPMEPLGGIVKIDIKIPDGNVTQDTVKLVDEISSEIYDMRLPSIYPWPRWPSYIYPIRIAESYMSSTFLGQFTLGQIGEEMKNAIQEASKK